MLCKNTCVKDDNKGYRESGNIVGPHTDKRNHFFKKDQLNLYLYSFV